MPIDTEVGSEPRELFTALAEVAHTLIAANGDTANKIGTCLKAT